MKRSVRKLRSRSFIIYLLLSLSGLSTIYFLYFPHACAGYESVFPVMISVCLFVLLFISNMIIQFLSRRNNDPARWMIPAGIVCALLAVNWLIPNLLPLHNKGNKVLEAYTAKCKCGDLSTLTLLDNGYYVIKMAETEYVCRYTGKYRLNGDTILLEKKILAETDSTYYPAYLINSGDSLLYPLLNGISRPGTGVRLTLGLLNIKSVRGGKITVLK